MTSATITALTTRVKTQEPALLPDHQLRNIRIIVDGYNLLSYLVQQQQRPHRHYGGQYESLSKSCHAFFMNLCTCQIWSFVIFSGVDDGRDRGDASRYIRNHQRRIDLAGKIALGDSGPPITPILAMEVLKDTLNSMRIPFAVCEHKRATNEITGLANNWMCPVLGSNQYYYLMDIKAGFLPLELLRWQDVCNKGSTAASLSCGRYLLSKFSKANKIQGSLMPLLVAMLEDDVLGTAINGIPWKRQNATKSATCSYVNGVLDWLIAAQASHNMPMAKLLDRLQEDKRITLKDKVAAHTKTLKPSDASHLAAYFTAKADGINHSTNSPSTWYRNAFREGKLPNTVINVIHTRRVFTPVQVEDHNLPSSNDISLTLRQILYGILLPYDHQTSPDVDAIVTEYDRSESSASCNQILPIYHVDNLGRFLHISHMPGISMLTKRRFLIASLDVPSGILGPMLASIPSCFHLPTCIVIYWKTNSWLVNSNHVRALLLTWILGMAKNKTNQQSTSETDDDAQSELDDWLDSEAVKLVHRFITNIEPTLQSDPTTHLEVTHCFAQLQSCMKAAFHINDVLQQAYPAPDVSVLYDGRMVHGMYAILKDIPCDKQEMWLESHMFPHAPTALALYHCLWGYIHMHTSCTEGYEEIY